MLVLYQSTKLSLEILLTDKIQHYERQPKHKSPNPTQINHTNEKVMLTLSFINSNIQAVVAI